MRVITENRLLSSRNLLLAIVLATIVVVGVGSAAALASWRTGDPAWIRSFFSYVGTPFLVVCTLIHCLLSFCCWIRFSPGDLLRPAWLLISLSGLTQFTGSFIANLLGSKSGLNPSLLLSGKAQTWVPQAAAKYGPLFNPVYMLLLAVGLFYVIKACRLNGMLGRFRSVDILLLGVVAVYTTNFFATAVFAPHRNEQRIVERILSWTSDPLLCLLLFEAILIRRSVANMGWGLVARCWLSFTTAIFFTSIGDIGLWAWAKGYLPPPLEVASWFVWFFASAAYAVGPTYQLRAMLQATSRMPVYELIQIRQALQLL
jgi:hypothetical protein